MALPLPDRVKATTATTGTGTVTLGAAVAPYRVPPTGFSGETVPYAIEDTGSSWETGQGVLTYSAGTWTLTRTLRESSTGSLLNLSGAATVMISPGGVDIAYESDVIDLLNSVSYLALLIGGLNGALGQLTNGFDDNYVDETGIDTGSSTNINYAAGVVTNLASGTSAYASSASIVPAMAADTGTGAAAGYVASSTGESNPAYEAFDNNSGTFFSSTSKTLPEYLQIKLPAAASVGAYQWQTVSGGAATYSWLFQGSNNGTSWTTLDTQTGIVIAGSTLYTYVIPTANVAAYSYYRFDVTSISAADYLYVTALNLFAPVTPAAMTLQSLAPVTLKSAPSRVGVYVLAVPPGGTINTDLMASVSRDGSTFTTGTLVAIATLGGKTLYELQGSDGLPGVIVTGQPSGATPKYKITTTATYQQTIDGVTLRAA